MKTESTAPTIAKNPKPASPPTEVTGPNRSVGADESIEMLARQTDAAVQTGHEWLKHNQQVEQARRLADAD